MAQHCVLAAREDRGHPMALDRQTRVAHGVDPAMDAVKAAPFHTLAHHDGAQPDSK